MKKLLAVFLCAVMLIPTLVSVVDAAVGELYLEQDFIYDETYMMGDVNSDENVDGKDALSLKANVAGLEGYPLDIQASDFDADGEASAKDSYSLKLVLSGAKTAEEFETVNNKLVQIYKLTIGGNALTDYSIVVPADSTKEENTYFAALNFMKYVRQATGVELPIVFGEKTTAKGVYFNTIDLKSEDGQYLGIDGYRYDITDGELHVYGTYRGNGYAVFDILEDYLGFRFYKGYETYQYKSRIVDLPEGVSVEKIPAINFRHARQTFGQYNGDNNEDGVHCGNGMCGHYFANKLNASEGGYSCYEKFYGSKLGPLYSNAHSFLEYWQMGTGSWPEGSVDYDDPKEMSKYMYSSSLYDAKFKSGIAPDPYSWQPCATSQNDYDTLFRGMIDCNRMVMSWGRPIFIEEGQTLFSFSIADNQNYCTCRNCNKIKREEGFSGLYLSLYNRATEDAQAYYPGVRLYGILYAKDFPKTIKPHKNFVILYCGVSCDNHMIGKEECYEKGGQLNGMKNDDDIEALTYWGNVCRETGTEIWFWIYPVTYHYYLVGCPNVFNFYWNMKWLHEEGNVTGFFYEGGGREYNFESLKEYAAVKYMWDMDMTFEEYCDIVKEYLYMNYGDGYEELYRYIEMQTEAGDQCGTCFVNNFDRPGDMYSYEYLAEHYDEMRALLETALEKAEREIHKQRIEKLIACCDFMGLTSVHNDWYLAGNRVEDYKARFDYMYDTIVKYDLDVFSSDLYMLPEEKNYEVNIMKQIYEEGSRRPGVDPY